MTNTDEDLDSIAGDVRQAMNNYRIESEPTMTAAHHPIPTTHLATTQQVITTTQHWTATEAATLLLLHAGKTAALHMTPDARTRALADIVGKIVRTVDTMPHDIAEIREAIVSDTYLGATEVDPATVPTVFDD